MLCSRFSLLLLSKVTILKLFPVLSSAHHGSGSPITFFETEFLVAQTCFSDQGDLGLVILLHLPSKGWDYRYLLPRLVYKVLRMEPRPLCLPGKHSTHSITQSPQYLFIWGFSGSLAPWSMPAGPRHPKTISKKIQ